LGFRWVSQFLDLSYGMCKKDIGNGYIENNVKLCNFSRILFWLCSRSSGIHYYYK